jgi:3-deoxy-D-manno-octulosonic-acid transferase
MRFVLDALYLLASPFVVLALLWPSRFFTRRRYLAGAAEKLGRVAPRAGSAPCLWVHAVSVGEVRTALPLLRALIEALPGWDFALSTSTDTGRALASMELARLERSPVAFYAPIDLSFSVARAFDAIRPAGVVLVELELWPNFLLEARRRGVPVLVVNGRLTERSARRYRRAGPLGRYLFSLPAAFAAQNASYQARFASLGVEPGRLAVLGNLKFDAAAPAATAASPLASLGWVECGAAGPGRPLVMAACTHPGEEAAALEAAKDLIVRHPRLGLILAPRHVERAREVHDLAAGSGLGPAALWSRIEGGAGPGGGAAPLRILVVDRIGVLDGFYRVADAVFVGGSLVPRGGHNLFEAARHGKAVLFGPSIFNFEDIAAPLLSHAAALQVSDARALGERLGELLDDPSRLQQLGERARQTCRELQGAVARHVEWIRGCLGAS